MSRLKSVIIITISSIMVIVALVIVISDLQKQILVADLPSNLELKVSKENIINYRISTNTNGVQTVSYNFVTTIVAGPDIYRGLSEDLAKRTANSQAFVKSREPINDKYDKTTYVGRFYTSPIFHQRGDKWYKVETATTTVSAFNQQIKFTLADNIKTLLGQEVFADTFYSGAGDGYVGNSSNSSWSSARGASSGTVTNYVGTEASAGSNQGINNYQVYRMFLPFNTSSILSGSSIASASLTIYVSPTQDNSGLVDTGDSFNIVQTTQASSNSLTSTDFDNCGSLNSPVTGATSIPSASLVVSTPVTFNFNSSGLSWIAKNGDTSSCGSTTGVTCLGVRDTDDMNNNSPSILAANDSTFYTSESIFFPPYLTVVYSEYAPRIKIQNGVIKIKNQSIKLQ